MGVSLSLVMLILTIPLHSEQQDRPFCSVSTGLYNHGTNKEILSHNFWSELDNFPSHFQTDELKEVFQLNRIKKFRQIFMGIAGGIVVGVGGAIAGYYISGGSSAEGFEGLGGIILGYAVGSVFGSALGVYWAGNSGGLKGDFRRTLTGSFLGMGVCAAPLLLHHEPLMLVGAVSSLVLPTLFAISYFNRSLNLKSSSVPKGLFNIKRKKLKIGIPQVQVNALPNLKNKYKPILRFNVRLLSLEL
jgi:hypothetical protein